MTIFCLRNTNSYTLDAGSAVDVWKQPLVWFPAGGPHSARFVEQAVLAQPNVAALVASQQVVPDPAHHAEVLREDLEKLCGIYAATFGASGAPAPLPPAAPAGPTAEEVAAEAAARVQEALEAAEAAKAAAAAAEDAALAEAEAVAARADIVAEGVELTDTVAEPAVVEETPAEAPVEAPVAPAEAPKAEGAPTQSLKKPKR